MQKDYVSKLYIKSYSVYGSNELLGACLVNCQTFRESRIPTCWVHHVVISVDTLEWTYYILVEPVALSPSLSVNDCFSFILGVTIINEDSNLWAGSLNVWGLLHFQSWLEMPAVLSTERMNKFLCVMYDVLFESVLM